MQVQITKTWFNTYPNEMIVTSHQDMSSPASAVHQDWIERPCPSLGGFKATTGVCEAHLHPSYKPYVTGAIPAKL